MIFFHSFLPTIMSKTIAQLCLVSSLTVLPAPSLLRKPGRSASRACCGARGQLPGHPQADLQAPAGRSATGPVPVRGQGDFGG
jgi:hypothetical protein